ncbi:hypothetical protein AAG906_004374 [Vitis piasezkii]
MIVLLCVIACCLSVWVAHLSPYLQPFGFGHFLHSGSHFCKCETLYYIDVWEHFGGDRHIDVDWSLIIEDLYSPELGFMDICEAVFAIGNPLGCRGSACVEVITTLHGSAPSLWRRVEGCSGFIILGQSRWEISWIFREIRHGSVIQDETPHDLLPPAPPPLVLIVPQASPYLLLGHSEITPPAAVHTMVIDDAHARMDLSDDSSVWDDLEGMPMASLPSKFRMLDIERYTDIGCPRIHLRLYNTGMRAHGLDESQMISLFPLSLSGAAQHWKELEALRQRSDKSVFSFISCWRWKIAEIIDRSLQPRIARHVVGVPFTDFGSLVLALYDVEDGISRYASCFIFCHRATMLCSTVYRETYNILS